jgi:hypothetical protein
MQFTKKCGIVFVLAAALLSLVFFAVLFSSARFTLDDFTISLSIREGSFFSALKWYYYNSSFRTTAMFLSWPVLGGSDPGAFVMKGFFYYFLLLLFSTYVIYKIVAEVFLKENPTTRERILLVAFSFIQISGVYFLCSDRIEIFGWITSSMVHVVPVMFALFAFWLIIKRKSQQTDHLLLFLSAICIGGSAENMVAVAFLTGLVYAGNLGLKKRSEKFLEESENKKMKKTIFFISTMALFFCFVFTNPGTLIRIQEVKQMSLNNYWHDGDFFKFMFKSHKLIGILFAIVSWTLFPFLFNTGENKKFFLKPTVIIFSIALLVTAITSKVTYNCFWITRMYFVVDAALYILIIALVIGYATKIKGLKFFIPVGVAICLALLVLNNVRHIQPLLRYASAYDKMVADLQKMKTGEVATYQLPDADLVCPVSMAENPNDIRNKEFCRFYGIKAKVIFIEAPLD